MGKSIVYAFILCISLSSVLNAEDLLGQYQKKMSGASLEKQDRTKIQKDDIIIKIEIIKIPNWLPTPSGIEIERDFNVISIPPDIIKTKNVTKIPKNIFNILFILIFLFYVWFPKQLSEK